MILSIGVQSLFHSVQSWRHLWVWLALALVWDLRQADAESRDARGEGPAHSLGIGAAAKDAPIER